MTRRLAMIALMAGALAAGLTASMQASEQTRDMTTMTTNLQKATFAGGCFWCVEADFDKVPGVIATVSGYTGGSEKNPTYKQVSAGATGHAEAVQITFDPARISYDTLLDAFWRSIDPTTANRQFCDVGRQYRTAIFYHDAQQKTAAEASKARLDAQKPFKETIVTEIVPAGEFYPAEDYHQDYYKKNPLRYRFYRNGCGRNERLEQLWGKKD